MRSFSFLYRSRSAFNRRMWSPFLSLSSASVANSRTTRSFSLRTCCSFSFMCVSACTCAPVFERIRTKSPFRASIFSCNAPFSILSCSKSTRNKPAASSSLSRTFSSVFASRRRSFAFNSRAFRAASSATFSSFSRRSITSSDKPLPGAPGYSAALATSALYATNAANVSDCLRVRKASSALISSADAWNSSFANWSSSDLVRHPARALRYLIFRCAASAGAIVSSVVCSVDAAGGDVEYALPLVLERCAAIAFSRLSFLASKSWRNRSSVASVSASFNAGSSRVTTGACA